MFLKDNLTEVAGSELNKASNPYFPDIRNVASGNLFTIITETTTVFSSSFFPYK